MVRSAFLYAYLLVSSKLTLKTTRFAQNASLNESVDRHLVSPEKLMDECHVIPAKGGAGILQVSTCSLQNYNAVEALMWVCFVPT